MRARLPSLLALLVLAAAPAHADFFDGDLATARGQERLFRLADGLPPLRARVLAVDDTTVTVVDDAGVVRAVPRAAIVEIIVPVPLRRRPAEPVVNTDRDAVVASIAIPANLAIDVEAHGFYAFASLSLLAPSVTGGKEAAGSLGLGTTIALGDEWHLDVFAFAGGIVDQDVASTQVGYGAGFGAHHVSAGGFTVAFKVPVLGWSSPAHPTFSSQGGVQGFLVASLIGLPLVSFGYRF